MGNCELCQGNFTAKKLMFNGKRMMVCWSCSFENNAKREKAAKKKRSGGLTLKRRYIKEYGSVCQKCGSNERLDAHHKIEIRNGGTNDPGNLMFLCYDCHRLEHKRG